MGISERVAARFMARKKPKLEPAINKEKDRMVYVLPKTVEQDSSTYEKVPEDSKDHIKNKGKPQRPVRPEKPRRPKKPEIPRGVDPAPQRPARRPVPALPVPPIPHNYIKPVPKVKSPSDNADEHRRWKIKKPKPLQD